MMWEAGERRTLPSGALTFLFTDIEGSTRLLQRLGEGYGAVRADHGRLIRAAVNEAGGTEVDTAGDGFFVVFPDALHAVQAAVSAQRRLGAHPWPKGGWVRVRMGLHTGTATLSEDGYVGLDVHRTARICSAAYGGQILLSAATRAAVGTLLPSEISVRHLGSYRLKDIDEPEQLVQVVAPSLPSDFPPPRSVDCRPHNLPSEVTEFVGRAEEVAEVKRQLGAGRMVTLLGPGGIGKTRLALRVAAEVLGDFEDGVFFVPLAEIRDSRVVLAALAQALDVRDMGGRPVLEALSEHLRLKQILLVLDNWEQVVEAAPQVGAMLAAAPKLKVLATSREKLRLTAEQVFLVPPLALPSSEHTETTGGLAAVPAVDLFIRRARATDPSFTLTSENARFVSQIVARLEGLPLAIELAAARCRLLPPKELAKRLDQRLQLQLLTDGLQDLPSRHRALRNTIRWSDELLNPSEKALLRRVGIFAGGFTVEAAEEVAAGTPVESVLVGLGSLLDKSLLQSRVVEGEGRLLMLESIREFALDELGAAGDTQTISARHAAFYVALAEELEPHLTHEGQVAALDRLATDLDNFRAALEFLMKSGDTATGLRIGSAIWRFWQLTGRLQEGRRWLTALLEAHRLVDVHRAKGLTATAGLAYWQGEYQTARTHYEAALAIYRGMGDRFNEADCLYSISTTLTWSGDALTGARLAEEALAMFEGLGAREKVGMVLMAQGFARWMQGDLRGARPLWERSLAIAIETGDLIEATVKRLAIASIDFGLGRAREALKSALDALTALGFKNVTYMVMAIDFVAALAVHGDPEGGARLAAAAASLRARLGGGMRPEASGLENARAVAARHLEAGTLERIWAEGSNMNLFEAVDYAQTLDQALENWVDKKPTSPISAG